MNKISEIFEAWVIAANPTEEQKDLAAKRHSICLDCKFIKNSFLFNTKCGECGCPINKKIFSPQKGACRVGKWDVVDGVDDVLSSDQSKNIKKIKSIV